MVEFFQVEGTPLHYYERKWTSACWIVLLSPAQGRPAVSLHKGSSGSKPRIASQGLLLHSYDAPPEILGAKDADNIGLRL